MNAEFLNMPGTLLSLLVED